MKNLFINFLSFTLALVAAFALIWVWIPVYNLISPQEGSIQALLLSAFVLISLAVFILTGMFLPGWLKILLNREDRLWKKIKKSFPHWAEASVNPGSLSVHWFEGYRDFPEVVHNYDFDLKNNQARFYDNTDKARLFFEGTVNEGVSFLLKKR